jgi:hypothetical protein
MVTRLKRDWPKVFYVDDIRYSFLDACNDATVISRYMIDILEDEVGSGAWRYSDDGSPICWPVFLGCGAVVSWDYVDKHIETYKRYLEK